MPLQVALILDNNATAIAPRRVFGVCAAGGADHESMTAAIRCTQG